MADLRSGSLFSGVTGLDLAVNGVFGTETAWFCDNDPAASAFLAHRYPGVPNLGDITAVDWAAVEPVDVLTGGFPCQDISAAGRRAGLRPGTRSGLWSHMAYAISQLRPRLVVIENVDALRSTAAHSDMEPCPWCVGDGTDEPALRALGAVLGDLAALGFDAEWISIPASGVGNCHLRWRVFIVAWPAADSAGDGLVGGSDASVRSGAARDAALLGWDAAQPAPRDVEPSRAPGGSGGESVADPAGPRRTGHIPGDPVEGNGTGPDGAGQAELGGLDRTAADPSRPGYPLGAVKPDRDERQAAERGHRDGGVDWGDYAAGIDRWARIIGRPAPVPRVPGPRGGMKLNPVLCEWMMGYPAGWITDVPGITLDDALRLAGNAVCPQQATAALRELMESP